jgi:hypothetical protein
MTIPSSLNTIQYLHTKIPIANAAQAVPNKAPITVSVGKCTPRKIRDKPTFAAQKYNIIFILGNHSDRQKAIKKAPDVWPDGKEN